MLWPLKSSQFLTCPPCQPSWPLMGKMPAKWISWGEHPTGPQLTIPQRSRHKTRSILSSPTNIEEAFLSLSLSLLLRQLLTGEEGQLNWCNSQRRGGAFPYLNDISQIIMIPRKHDKRIHSSTPKDHLYVGNEGVLSFSWERNENLGARSAVGQKLGRRSRHAHLHKKQCVRHEDRNRRERHLRPH